MPDSPSDDRSEPTSESFLFSLFDLEFDFEPEFGIGGSSGVSKSWYRFAVSPFSRGATVVFERIVLKSRLLTGK